MAHDCIQTRYGNVKRLRNGKTMRLGENETLHIPISCLYAIMSPFVTDQFWVRAFTALDFVLHFPSFSHTSAERVRLSQPHGRLLDLLKTTCHQSISIIQNNKYYQLNDYSIRKWRGAPSMGLTNLAYGSQQETHWRENLKSAIGRK